ncbi:hypothetical protein [Rhodopila sp.]|uniref:hypothetical protein n=1 Tax=Rhodopila sp. TaxID=2480087 RepID=UPI003D0D2460
MELVDVKVAEQLGEVRKLDEKAFAVPRAGWAEAFEQFGIPIERTRATTEWPVHSAISGPALPAAGLPTRKTGAMLQSTMPSRTAV